jgi:formylglycine-generating enzyme required for sulfatase activity
MMAIRSTYETGRRTCAGITMLMLALIILLSGCGTSLSNPTPTLVSPASPTLAPTATPVPPTETPLPPTPTPVPPTATPLPPTPTPSPTSTPPSPPSEAVLEDTWLRPADGMVMVYVPAGRFNMGSVESEPCAHLDEFPQHAVYLDGFWIDQTEVTNAQYQQCVDAGLCSPPVCDWGEPTYDDVTKGDYPVTCVNWDEARTYCEWAGGRLPTEAQWEKAARGTDERGYPWGNEFDENRCNSGESGIGETTPVKSYSPEGDSPYGAADMAGNAYEWVIDWYDIEYYATSPSENPTGPRGGEGRGLRGGNWYGDHCNARATYRYYDVPHGRSNGVGFRCVVNRSVPDSTPREHATEAPVESSAVVLTEEPRLAEISLGDVHTRPTDGMVMVGVPAGEFRMGTDTDELRYARELCKEYLGELATATCLAGGFGNEQPAHTVALNGFWIDRTEVTNGQYRQCVEAGGCEPPVESGSFTRDSYYGDSGYDNYPVIWVRWDQASGYCAWAGGRLPTEAEWEYAARGPEGLVFPWGDTFDGTRVNYCDVGCDGVNDETTDDGYPDTAPVGSFPAGASWCGALDMAGNVREWVADWFVDYSSGRQVNPTSPPGGDSRIPRGGSWYDTPDDVRSANRGENSPDYTRHKVGFRCARSVE